MAGKSPENPGKTPAKSKIGQTVTPVTWTFGWFDYLEVNATERRRNQGVKAMLTVNHIITASILVFMVALSPMTIALTHETGPLVASVSNTANR